MNGCHIYDNIPIGVCVGGVFVCVCVCVCARACVRMFRDMGVCFIDQYYYHKSYCFRFKAKQKSLRFSRKKQKIM